MSSQIRNKIKQKDFFRTFFSPLRIDWIAAGRSHVSDRMSLVNY